MTELTTVDVDAADFMTIMFTAMKASPRFRWLGRVMTVIVIVAIAAVPLTGEQSMLAKPTTANPSETPPARNVLETAAMAPHAAGRSATTARSEPATALGGQLPNFDGAVAWLNSAPLTGQALRGKVVLVDFWTYSCINSLRELPYVKAWAAKYKDAGLVVIGVHTPEFSFEKDRANVERAVQALSVTYPVPMDNGYKVWQAFNNEYWPADYLIDGKGRIRYHHFGEGSYAESERVIQKLLTENRAGGVSSSTVRLSAAGIEAAPSETVQSPETYVGYRRAESFASPESVTRDALGNYTPPAHPSLNQWGLRGSWNVGAEGAVLGTAPGSIVFRFHARDLHLVVGRTGKGPPVRFKVMLDGAASGDGHGLDVAPDGTGEIREPRLYQLIRQTGQVRDRTVTIDFLDSGVEAFVFTFG